MAPGAQARRDGSEGGREGGARERSGGPDERAAGSEPVAQPEGPERWHGFVLNPFQRRALAALERGLDVLVGAPTGAGKTLVAEYAIELALRRGRRAIYTAPIKALSNQKYRDFRAELGTEVGILTGDVTIRPDAQVLIMTTEILRNSIFERSSLLDEVDWVVFDEIHYMDDAERGTVWEECLIFAPLHVRFVSLSATIANQDELAAWMGEIRGRQVASIASSKRPVPLEHWLFTERSGAFPLSKLDRMRKREAREPGPRERGPRGRERGGRRGRRGPVSELRPPEPERLLDELERRRLLPALVFAFSRRDCERLARGNGHRRLLDQAESARMEALQRELVETFQLSPRVLEEELFQLARGGLAWHHAGLLPLHKELVERLFTSGLIKLLFTTETFALGINMPARSVVFTSLRKFDGIDFDYLSVRDHMQMAGRAGRQGLDDSGLVYSLLSPRDLAAAPLRRIFSGRPEPVESRFRLSFSSLLHLVERAGRERIHEAWDKSFDHWQHRSASPKVEARNRREQQRLIDAHLALLDDLGYLEGDELLPRGRVARSINGFELQATELLFGGQVENLPAQALAVVFVGLTWEDRRRGGPAWVPKRLFGPLRAAVDAAVQRIVVRAAELRLPVAVKRPDWGLSPAVLAWAEGATFEELAAHTDVPPGDLCRAFRMGNQLMRLVRKAIGPDWDLYERLGEALARMNRDEVDARRQLELG
jgi:superfamily II RNA helicase